MCGDKTIIALQKAGVSTGENYKRRVVNINFFASLDRNKYTYTSPAPSLKMYTAQSGEEIYVVYPGKESNSNRQSPKPWDFRPILEKNGIRMKDLSFGEIWQFLSDFIQSNNRTKNQNAILLARLLYKTAFLHLHKLDTTSNFFKASSLKGQNRKFYVFNIQCPNFTKNEKEILREAINVIDVNGNPMTISIESFIVYNDFLCSNEDCKYFYRKNKNLKTAQSELEKHIKNINGIKKYRGLNWESSAGRINTILTHINFLVYLAGGKDIFNLLEEASRGQGIFPVSNNQLLINFSQIIPYQIRQQAKLLYN